jgi:glycosidase
VTFPFTAAKIDRIINPDVTAEYGKIIAFRNASNAIRRGKLTFYTTSDVCAFIKKIGAEKVIVISNLRNTPVSFSIPPAYICNILERCFYSFKKSFKQYN